MSSGYTWGHLDRASFDPTVSALLQELLRADGDWHKLADAEDSEGQRSLLSAWEAEELVIRSTAPLGESQWQLTDLGKQSIIVAFALYKRTLFLEPRSIAVGEMSKFELLQKLESSGWAFCLAPVRSKELKKLKSSPYVCAPRLPEEVVLEGWRQSGETGCELLEGLAVRE